MNIYGTIILNNKANLASGWNGVYFEGRNHTVENTVVHGVDNFAYRDTGSQAGNPVYLTNTTSDNYSIYTHEAGYFVENNTLSNTCDLNNL